MARSPKDDLRYLEGKFKQNPDSILFARLAEAYLAVNRIDDAIKLCENGLRKHPYYVTGHYIMSKCYFSKKQFDNAEKELKRVLLFDPEYISAHRDYGDLMTQIGWNSSCVSSYERIVSVDPLNKKARQKLDEIREKQKQTGDTDTELDIELGEFEEEAIVYNDTNIQQDESQEEMHDEEEHFPEKMETQQEDIDNDEEKFSYILDDIFRDDSIDTELDITKTDADIAEVDIDLEHEEDFEKDIDHTLEAPQYEERDFQTKPENIIDEAEDEDFNFNDEVEDVLRDDDYSAEYPYDTTTKDENDFDEELPKFSLEDFEENTGDEKYLSDVENNFDEVIDNSLDNEPTPIQSIENDIDEYPASEEDKFFPKSKNKEKIVTPTLGEIYAAQHQYAKAIGVYEILKKNNPNNPIYQQKIDYLKKKLEESQDED